MKGSYILILKLEKNRKINVGKIGKIEFKKGYYCYVGSARGKNLEIEKRIKRYFKLNKEKNGNLRWHIDYLLVDLSVKIIDILKTRKKECELVKEIEKNNLNYVKRFGCSDCKCKSHLFFHFSNPKRILLKLLK